MAACENSQSSTNNYTLMPDYNSRKVGNYDSSILYYKWCGVDGYCRSGHSSRWHLRLEKLRNYQVCCLLTAGSCYQIQERKLKHLMSMKHCEQAYHLKKKRENLKTTDSG